MLYVLFNPFITLWLGNSYIFSMDIVVCIIIAFYLKCMRRGVLAFRAGGGLYWNDRYKAILEVVVNLGASYYLGLIYGTIGVVMGWILSTLLAPFWIEPFVLYNNLIKEPLKKYFIEYCKYALLTLCIAYTFGYCYIILQLTVNIFNFIFTAISVFIAANVVWILVFCKSSSFNYVIDFLRKKTGR